MSESEFIAAWIAALGQPPALMLERGEMIAFLLSAGERPAPANAAGACRNDLRRAA